MDLCGLEVERMSRAWHGVSARVLSVNAPVLCSLFSLFLREFISFGFADGLLTLILVDVQGPLCGGSFSIA